MSVHVQNLFRQTIMTSDTTAATSHGALAAADCRATYAGILLLFWSSSHCTNITATAAATVERQVTMDNDQCADDGRTSSRCSAASAAQCNGTISGTESTSEQQQQQCTGSRPHSQQQHHHHHRGKAKRRRSGGWNDGVKTVQYVVPLLMLVDDILVLHYRLLCWLLASLPLLSFLFGADFLAVESRRSQCSGSGDFYPPNDVERCFSTCRWVEGTIDIVSLLVLYMKCDFAA